MPVSVMIAVTAVGTILCVAVTAVTVLTVSAILPVSAVLTVGTNSVGRAVCNYFGNAAGS